MNVLFHIFLLYFENFGFGRGGGRRVFTVIIVVIYLLQ